MYNPQYLERPYVVVLNKIDLPKVLYLKPVVFYFYYNPLMKILPLGMLGFHTVYALLFIPLVGPRQAIFTGF